MLLNFSGTVHALSQIIKGCTVKLENTHPTNILIISYCDHKRLIKGCTLQDITRTLKYIP